MSTHPRIIFIIVCAMAAYVPLGMLAVFLLILWKADPALIAVMAGFVGTALGGLMSMLNNTRTQGADPAAPIKTEIVNPTSDPVNTKPV